MSFQATAWAVTQRTRNVNTQCLLLVLSQYADEDGVAWPSIQRLSDESRLSRSAVMRNLDHLIEDGHLVKRLRRVDGHQATNSYELQLQGVRDTPCRVSEQGVRDTPSQGVTGDTLIVIGKSVRKEPNGPLRPSFPNSQRKASSARMPAHEEPQPLLVEEIPEEAPSPPVKALRPMRISSDWWPPEENFKNAKRMFSCYIDVDLETAQFRDRHLARGDKLEDWLSEWRYWIRTAVQFRKEKMRPEEKLIAEVKEIHARGLSADPDKYRQLEQMGLLGEVMA